MVLTGSRPEEIKKFKVAKLAKAKPGVVATLEQAQPFGEALALFATFIYVTQGVIIIGKNGKVAA